jgi:hypothetical protein
MKNKESLLANHTVIKTIIEFLPLLRLFHLLAFS